MDDIEAIPARLKLLIWRMVQEGILGPLSQKVDTFRILSMLDALRRTVISLVEQPSDVALEFNNIFETEARWLMPSLYKEDDEEQVEELDPVDALRALVLRISHA